ACGGEASTTAERAPGPKPIEAPPGQLVQVSAPSPTCTSADLAVHKDDRGFVARLHASVEAMNQEAAFLVDTGSERTYAVTTSWGPQTTDAVIGCRTTSVPVVNRDTVTKAPDGRPQRGMLGADLLAHDAFLDLDLRAGKLAWLRDAPESPEESVVVP